MKPKCERGRPRDPDAFRARLDVRIPAEMLAEIKARAKLWGMSVPDWVRLMLARELRRKP